MAAANKPAASQGPTVRAKRPPIEQPESLLGSVGTHFTQLDWLVPFVQVALWQVPGPL